MTSNRDCGFCLNYFVVAVVAKANLESFRHSVTNKNIYFSSSLEDLQMIQLILIFLILSPVVLSALVLLICICSSWKILIIIDIWSMMWLEAGQSLIESFHAWCEMSYSCVDSLTTQPRQEKRCRAINCEGYYRS